MVLHPFEVAYRYPTCIGDNVRNQINAILLQDQICRRCCGIIGRFDNQLGFDMMGIAGMNLVVNRCGNQDIAIQLDQFLIGQSQGAGHAYQVQQLVD